MSEEHNSTNRFGGQWFWELGENERLYIGQTVEAEGPGKGVAMFPWILDHYERMLRLRPGETWLLKRMLKHAWKFRGLVYISMRKVAREAIVDRKTLTTWTKRLLELNYITLISRGEGSDRRRRYDVSGIYAALVLCIAVDPNSRWSQERGEPLPIEAARGLTHNRRRFDLDFDALDILNHENTKE